MLLASRTHAPSPHEPSLSDVTLPSADRSRSFTAAGAADDGALRRRIAGIAATVLAELVVIALLLTLGWNVVEGDGDSPAPVTFEARNLPAETPSEEEEQAQPEAAESEAEPVPRPPEPERAEEPPLEPPELALPPALELPLPRPVAPQPAPAPAPPPAEPRPKRSPPKAVIRSDRAYGPVDSGPPGAANDSERVGTAPNGEPMYAARWYREPTRQDLAGYLSTASGPGAALIACRTVPDFRVEDCELLAETPRGSQIGRAVLAAAWQFRVRPAIIGGRSQVGSWVRIRIDYRQAVAR
ncbi:protein TonB [Erythrobacter sp. HL-111]|nr:MAG: periplasmic protein TonB [Erythrobacteraceae bacterium HL-111]SDS52893.1 protein TonB [Erythrobacter sp. HL-111]